MNNQKLNYNQKLKTNARELRKGRVRSEVMLWQELQKKKFKGLTFNRQISIGNYIVDFFCAKAKVAIEIDGKSHQIKQEYDKKRDEYLQNQGLTVIHIEHLHVIDRLDYVMYHLEKHSAFASHTPPPARGGTPLS